MKNLDRLYWQVVGIQYAQYATISLTLLLYTYLIWRFVNYLGALLGMWSIIIVVPAVLFAAVFCFIGSVLALIMLIGEPFREARRGVAVNDDEYRERLSALFKNAKRNLLLGNPVGMTVLLLLLAGVEIAESLKGLKERYCLKY